MILGGIFFWGGGGGETAKLEHFLNYIYFSFNLFNHILFIN